MWTSRPVPAVGLHVITSYTIVVFISLTLIYHRAGYGVDWGAELRFLTEAKSFPFPPLLPGSMTTPPSNPICNGVLYPAAKWPRRAAANSLPSNWVVKNTKNIALILFVEGNQITRF